MDSLTYNIVVEMPPSAFTANKILLSGNIPPSPREKYISSDESDSTLGWKNYVFESLSLMLDECNDRINRMNTP